MQKLNTLNNQNDDNNNDGSKDNNINNDNSSNKHNHNNRRDGKSKKVYNRPNSPEGFTSDIDYIKNRFKKNPSVAQVQKYITDNELVSYISREHFIYGGIGHKLPRNDFK